MGLTKITKNELNSWKTRYEASINDQNAETRHCIIHLGELRKFLAYIDEKNQEEEKKGLRIGCLRVYFVRPSREFTTTDMKFVKEPNPVFKSKESFPQMRIAIVPAYVNRNPSENEGGAQNLRHAHLINYFEGPENQIMCLYPGAALNNEEMTNLLNKPNPTPNEKTIIDIINNPDAIMEEGNETIGLCPPGACQ